MIDFIYSIFRIKFLADNIPNEEGNLISYGIIRNKMKRARVHLIEFHA